MSVLVEVLEEALCIESVLSHKLHELSNHSLDILSLLSGGLESLILSLSSSNSDINIKLLLETLLGEDFINIVAEVSPPDMLSSLLSLVSLTEFLKLLVGDWDFSHAETHSELV